MISALVATTLLVGSGSGDTERESSAQNSDEAAVEETVAAPPLTEPCPHHEEIAEVPEEEQYETALDLGCEYGIHGEITFNEPIREDSASITDELIDPSRALSEEEMREAGYLEN